MRRLAILLGVLLFGVVMVPVALLMGMRSRSPRVLDAVRRVNRALLNPMQMRSAGTPGAYASIIRHRGRSSGRDYQTPVAAVPTDDGFVIALVYGARTDWLRNVIAAGSATIVHEGRSYRVGQPEVIPLHAAADWLPPSDQRNLRRFGVDQVLRVRQVEQQP